MDGCIEAIKKSDFGHITYEAQNRLRYCVIVSSRVCDVSTVYFYTSVMMVTGEIGCLFC